MYASFCPLASITAKQAISSADQGGGKRRSGNWGNYFSLFEEFFVELF
jgi:hypothetical protein